MHSAVVGVASRGYTRAVKTHEIPLALGFGGSSGPHGAVHCVGDGDSDFGIGSKGVTDGKCNLSACIGSIGSYQGYILRFFNHKIDGVRRAVSGSIACSKSESVRATAEIADGQLHCNAPALVAHGGYVARLGERASTSIEGDFKRIAYGKRLRIDCHIVGDGCIESCRGACAGNTGVGFIIEIHSLNHRSLNIGKCGIGIVL